MSGGTRRRTPRRCDMRVVDHTNDARVRDYASCSSKLVMVSSTNLLSCGASCFATKTPACTSGSASRAHRSRAAILGAPPPPPAAAPRHVGAQRCSRCVSLQRPVHRGENGGEEQEQEQARVT